MKCGTGHIILESKSCGFWHTFLILIYVAATKSPIIASLISQYQDLNFSYCYKYKHFSMQCCLISSKWRQRSQKCLVVERRRQATHVSHAIRIFQVTKNWTKKCLAEKLLLPHHPWQGGTCIRWHYWLFVLTFLQIKERGSLINKRFVKVHGMRATFDKRQTLENHVKTFNASGSDIDSISFPNKFYFAMSDSASLSPSIYRATMVWGNIYPDQPWETQGNTGALLFVGTQKNFTVFGVMSCFSMHEEKNKAQNNS